MGVLEGYNKGIIMGKKLETTVQGLGFRVILGLHRDNGKENMESTIV